jgi:FtsZ-interacting cell division protein ZipA
MNYELIIVAAIAVLGIILSGKFWLNLKNLIKQSSEFMEAVSDAIADDKIDNAEIINILDEAKDVGVAAICIMKLIKGKS